jgi:hypothetical protein
MNSSSSDRAKDRIITVGWSAGPQSDPVRVEVTVDVAQLQHIEFKGSNGHVHFIHSGLLVVPRRAAKRLKRKWIEYNEPGDPTLEAEREVVYIGTDEARRRPLAIATFGDGTEVE